MQRDVAAKPQKMTLGVIDAIADGLSVALARPLLFLLPMLLDFYYWVGWRIKIDALTSPIRDRILATDRAGAEDVASALNSIGRSDITGLLSLFLPSLLGGTPRSNVYQLGTRPVLTPEHWLVNIFLLVAIVAGFTLLMAAFLVPVADAVLNRPRSPKQTSMAIGTAWLRLTGTIFASAGIALLILGPLAVISGIMIGAGSNGAALFGFGLGLVMVCAMLFLFFAPDAIVVSHVGPCGAIKYSILMVRGYFGQTIGLIAATFLIDIGLGQIWRELADSAPGLLIGVIATAFIGTGLAAASFIFYANRIQLLKLDIVA